MASKWHFALEINESLNKMGEGAKTVVFTFKVKMGEEWVDLESGSLPCWSLGCQMSKYHTGCNIRLT